MPTNDILREFLLETHENLALLDADLITLENNPADTATLAQVFRTLHSVKGTAGFMGLVKLQAVSHAAESLLSRLRAGAMQFNRPIATALLQVVDAIRAVLAAVETSGGEGSGDYTRLIADLERLRESGGAELALPTTETQEVTAFVVDDPVVNGLALRSPPSAMLKPLASPPPPQSTRPQPTDPRLTAPQPVVPSRPAPLPSSPAATVALSLTELGEPTEPRAGAVADSSIRVDVALLDNLMALVGELVLARNQILKFGSFHDDQGFLGATQRLNLLTTELQTNVMKTRMQPIGNLWNKFPRVVRDLAIACGKNVRFEMEGQETELDKTLIEAIRDPLTHIIRNAIDHGVEKPEVRLAARKPTDGLLRIVAFHEGGNVVVEVSDDGAGIDIERVREKALRSNLITPEAAAQMLPQQLRRLIFLPGFSTTDGVTQFSGRGVGMDVVRNNIEKIGGTVDVESTPGAGTKIRAKIPLTLAIIPALIVDCGSQRYAIPQVSLLELVWIDPEDGTRSIERIQGTPVYRLRGKLLPLLFLDEQLQITPSWESGHDRYVVVVQSDQCQFGLVVDAIDDTEEIVVKPLQPQLKGIPIFGGAAIMGDGRVALILDVRGLAQHAQIASGGEERNVPEPTRADAVVDREPIVLFEPLGGGAMAVPLAQVARLEEIPWATVETVGAQLVVQYRGEILPLVDIAEQLDRNSRGAHRTANDPLRARANPPAARADVATVVVCQQRRRRIGLVVDRILDVIDEPVSARCEAHRPGILFTAVVQDRVTEFVDVEALLCETNLGVSLTYEAN